MRKTSQSLPRHTNLASQGLRFVATIVDIAIGLAITLVFYFACFNLILSNTTNELRETMDTYRLESHLQIKREDGSVGIVENTVESYESALQGYYLRYLTGKPLEGEGIAPNSNKTIVVDNVEVLPKDLYTVSYYNKNVLGITQDNPDGEQSASYFTYQKDENGNFLKDELAIKRDHYYDADLGHQVELTDTLFLAKYQEIYVTAYYHLVNQEFFTVISNDYYFFYTLGIVASIAIAGIINYIVIPFFMKNGQTIGKKIFKLGLASYDGYKFSNFQLLLRIVPFLLVDGALLLPIWSNIFYIFAIVIIVVLVSFALMMASPKKAALHDFAARTIVVNLETSILFENEIEEEDYIEKEDNLPKEIYAGEEPELRYEK